MARFVWSPPSVIYCLSHYLQLAYHASDDEPQARWAVVCSGLHYVVIYIPRDLDRRIFYCTPVMTFCLERGKPQDASQSPPIWSLLIYMALTESLNLHDRILRENLGLPHSSGDQSLSDLGSGNDTQGLRQSGTAETTKGADERLCHAGKLTEVGWQPFFFSFAHGV